MPLICAREPLAEHRAPTVFLAGPTPRSGDVASWRPAMTTALHQRCPELTVYTPESRRSIRAEHYDDQVEWEHAALNAATVIAFWIPRDVKSLPAFTTNVEYGLWAASGKVVLGVPEDCPNPERNRYLIWHARRLSIPVTTTLEATADVAIGMVEEFETGSGSERKYAVGK